MHSTHTPNATPPSFLRLRHLLPTSPTAIPFTVHILLNASLSPRRAYVPMVKSSKVAISARLLLVFVLAITPLCSGSPTPSRAQHVLRSFLRDPQPKLSPDTPRLDALSARKRRSCRPKRFRCYLCESCYPFRMLTPPSKQRAPHSPPLPSERSAVSRTHGLSSGTESVDAPFQRVRPFSSMTCSATKHYKYFKKDECSKYIYANCGCKRLCSWKCLLYLHVWTQ